MIVATVEVLRAFAMTLAILSHGPVWSATWVAAYQPQFGSQGPPYSGILKLNFNHNIISGTYDSTSSRPDPMYGRIINVTGTYSKSNVILHIASLTMLNGHMDQNGTITGTVTWQGRLYNFMAKIKSQP